MQFDLVIFDCDGVLIDSELLSIRADRECLAECGLELSAEEILDRYTGISFAGMVADIGARHGPLAADFADRHRRHLWPLFERELRAIPGVAAVLDSLICPTCVASSGRPERLKHALSLVGLYDRFHPHIFSAVEVARGKPAPDLFLYAAAQMGAAPERCVVIEDSVPGVMAAVAAGIECHWLCRRQPLQAGRGRAPRCARRCSGDRRHDETAAGARAMIVAAGSDSHAAVFSL